MENDKRLALIRAMPGKVVTGIRRVFYVYRGVAEKAHGPIEFSFSDSSIILLDAGPDGYTLAVQEGVWVDPFAEPLSPENRQFVADSGKWTGFDVSAEDGYRNFVGQPIEEINELCAHDGMLSGLVVIFPAGAVKVAAEYDEMCVTLPDVSR